MPEKFITDIVESIRDTDKTIRKGFARPPVRIRRFGGTPQRQPREPFESFRTQGIPRGETPETIALAFGGRPPVRPPSEVFQPFQQQPREFPDVSGRATQPLTFEEAGRLPEQFDPSSAEEQARQQAVLRGETHYLSPLENVWKLVEKPRAPLAFEPPEAYQDVEKVVQDLVQSPAGQVATLAAGLGIIVFGIGVPAAQQSWRALTNLALMRQISRWASEKNIAVSKDEAQIFANTLRNYASQRGFKWDLDKRVLKDFFKPLSGKTVPTPQAASKATETATEAVNKFAPAIIPRGTQTGALAFGGKTPPSGVPPAVPTPPIEPTPPAVERIVPPEVQAEELSRANAQLKLNPITPNTVGSIGMGESGEIVIRTDAQGRAMVTELVQLRDNVQTVTMIVKAKGLGEAGKAAVKEVLNYNKEHGFVSSPDVTEYSEAGLARFGTPSAVEGVAPVSGIEGIRQDVNLLREERIYIETMQTKGSSVVSDTGRKGTIVEPAEDYLSDNIQKRQAQVKWEDGSEWVVDSRSLNPSQLQKDLADFTQGKAVPPFPSQLTPEPLRTVPEGVAPPAEPSRPPTTPQAQQVEKIQQQGRTAPESVPPEEAKISHTEKAAPDGPRQPPPPAKPPAVGKPEEPSEILKDILAKQVEGERPDQTVMRLYGAAARTVKRRTGDTVKEGSAKLKDKGIGVTKRGFLVPREKDKPKLLELYNALHNPSKVASGEIAVPEGYDEIYTELRGLADWDTAARLDFDPNAATIEDWFFRGWKPPEGMFGEAQKGQLGTKPRALRMPRVNATFEEMIDLGFEPLFWNPYQQWGYRHNLGEIYREQMELVSHLKSLGDDLIRPDMGGALPAGWKIPKIGPAFEGKPFAAVDGDGKPGVMFTRRWAVPTKTANLLESMFGKRPDIGTLAVFGKTIDPLTMIDWIAFVPKRAKLLLSLFQQMDFLTRSGGGSWGRAIDALISGKPVTAATSALRFPKTALDIIHANLSPAKRLSLSKQLDDTAPLIEGRPGINLKGISEAGLSVMDETIWAAEMDKLMSAVAENTGIWGKIKGAGSSLVDLESAMRRGLFQGVYPAAMITEIKNNIATMMVKQHPTATDAQINGYIAKEVNKKYSTIPPEQSVIQNTFVRELLRRITFSFGESEALLRQASGMFHGPNKRFWIKENIGQIIFVLVVANIIHFLSTGEPLPKERYSPVAEDNWGPLPFGYNTKFASPTIPWQGRGGTELTVDLMGQMDTAYRILDPASFISARASVPIRAMVNQVSGTDFYGAPIDDVGPGGITSRLTQLIYDMFAPIGVGGISTAALRDAIPGETIPRGEERLGFMGLGLQATGLNIRAERTRDLLDRYASESGLFKRDGTLVQNWSELEPHQKDKVIDDMTLVEELEIRSEISAERGYPGAQGYATLLKLEQQRIKRGEALVTDFNNDLMDARTFRNEVTKLKLEIASRRSQVDEDFQLFEDNQELPEDQNKRALVEYYTLFDNAKRESGVIDWDRLDRLEAQLRARWTPEQRSYVDDNTGLTEWGPLMTEYIEASELLSPYWEVPEGSTQAEKRKQMRRNSRELDAALVKWYGYKPIKSDISTTPRRLNIPTTVPPTGREPVTIRRF